CPTPWEWPRFREALPAVWGRGAVRAAGSRACRMWAEGGLPSPPPLMAGGPAPGHSPPLSLPGTDSALSAAGAPRGAAHRLPPAGGDSLACLAEGAPRRGLAGGSRSRGLSGRGGDIPGAPRSASSLQRARGSRWAVPA
ncbi:hypothetical protein lerEdw1_015922, partial [Lerista edwardsae]